MNQLITPTDQLEYNLRQILCPKQFEFTRRELEYLGCVLTKYAKLLYMSIDNIDENTTQEYAYRLGLQKRSDIEIAYDLNHRFELKVANLRRKSLKQYKVSLQASEICVLQSALDIDISHEGCTFSKIIHGRIHQKTV